jgi:hypothetical protein
MFEIVLHHFFKTQELEPPRTSCVEIFGHRQNLSFDSDAQKCIDKYLSFDSDTQKSQRKVQLITFRNTFAFLP